ncbi:MAG: hypothetical protein R2706_11410 [Acidimicrobiales bacterium]
MVSVLKHVAVWVLVMAVAVGCVNPEKQAEIDRTRAEVTEIYENLPVPSGFTQSEIQVSDPDLGQFTAQSGSISTSWQAPNLGAPAEVLDVIHSHMTNHGYQLAGKGSGARCSSANFSVSYINERIALDIRFQAGLPAVVVDSGWSAGFIASGQPGSSYTIIDVLPNCAE